MRRRRWQRLGGRRQRRCGHGQSGRCEPMHQLRFVLIVLVFRVRGSGALLLELLQHLEALADLRDAAALELIHGAVRVGAVHHAQHIEVGGRE